MSLARAKRGCSVVLESASMVHVRLGTAQVLEIYQTALLFEIERTSGLIVDCDRSFSRVNCLSGCRGVISPHLVVDNLIMIYTATHHSNLANLDSIQRLLISSLKYPPTVRAAMYIDFSMHGLQWVQRIGGVFQLGLSID